MSDEIQRVLQDIRSRDNAIGELATRSQAEFALNDCHTLLAIIDELQRNLARR